MWCVLGAFYYLPLFDFELDWVLYSIYFNTILIMVCAGSLLASNINKILYTHVLAKYKLSNALTKHFGNHDY